MRFWSGVRPSSAAAPAENRNKAATTQRSIDCDGASSIPLRSAARARRMLFGGPPVPDVYVRTLERAVKIEGGEQALALRLKVTPSHLALWIQGIERPPVEVFLRAVDLVTDQLFPPPATRAREPEL